LLTGFAFLNPRPSDAFFMALIIGGGPHKRSLTSSAGFGSHFCKPLVD
jgi:hypothetical protein